jgi:hypothetical protein
MQERSPGSGKIDMRESTRMYAEVRMSQILLGRSGGRGGAHCVRLGGTWRDKSKNPGGD